MIGLLLVVVLPALVAALAFGCVIAIGRDAVRRPKPDRIAWIVAFLLFGIGATAEVIGEASGWNATLARVYYLSGAVLVVGFLALGQLYLLAGNRIGRFAPGVTILLTAVSASTVWGAPIDRGRIDADGWDAIERTTGLKILAIGINSIGTLILLGGLLYSVYRFRKGGQFRNRTIGCLLIALGTLSVAMGGTATRLGSDGFLYVAMLIGISLIFSGYLVARRPDSVGTATRPTQRVAPTRATPTAASESASAISFVESLLLTLDDATLAEECRVWSVPAREMDAFNRAEARRAWSFRTRLSAAGQTAFDNRPVAIRQQLTELWFEVLAPEMPARDRPVMTPLDRIAPHD
ncbi:MAG: hypothetical protein M3Y37_02625, partial [Chloroflexota bacterium]|nr:hypothetical protein [Chloroflexota bacterium]